jgi:hypothetical protein
MLVKGRKSKIQTGLVTTDNFLSTKALEFEMVKLIILKSVTILSNIICMGKVQAHRFRSNTRRYSPSFKRL